MSILRSTFNDNKASNGGGIYQKRGKLALVNSTLSHNGATSTGAAGGGITANGGVTIKSSTITLNTSAGSGGGIQGSAMVGNTIIAGNTAASDADCAGSLTSEGYNLLRSPIGCAVGGNTAGNISAVDAMLGALADNGGATPTHALLSTSPAIDAGDPAGCSDEDGLTLATDQRVDLRTVDGDASGSPRCDIGAVEAPKCAGKPAVPTQLAPDPAQAVGPKTTLDWSDVACATYYKVVLRQGSTTGPIVRKDKHVYVSEFDAYPPDNVTTYFWQVRACNAKGCRHTPLQQLQHALGQPQLQRTPERRLGERESLRQTGRAGCGLASGSGAGAIARRNRPCFFSRGRRSPRDVLGRLAAPAAPALDVALSASARAAPAPGSGS